MIKEGYPITAWCNIIFILPNIGELCLYWKISLRKNKVVLSPKLEIEKTKDVEDSYNRKPFCESVHENLKTCFYKERSFSVAITGHWGSGKTTFIEYLKQLYKNTKESNNKPNVSIINFEPWKYDSSELIIKNFFSQLQEELYDYIPSIYSPINDYVDILLDNETVKPVKLIKKSFEICGRISTDPYKIIKNALESAGHKIVVFIDDIDRLNVNEIKEVLRLIRNTADFPYIQFVSAYDKQYVADSLSQYGIQNPNLYIEKFFNVEIALPKCENRIICDELYKRMKDSTLVPCGFGNNIINVRFIIYRQSKQYENEIISDYIVPKFLPTIRDVIRFHNILNIVLQSYAKQKIQNEVLFEHLFLLELLAYKYDKCVTRLANTPSTILYIKEKKLHLNRKNEVSFYKSCGYEEDEDKNNISQILKLLFENVEYPNGINKVRSFYKYFMYRLDDRILTISEILSLINAEDEDIIKTVNTWYDKKYPKEIETTFYESLNLIPPSENEDSNDQTIYSYKTLYPIVKKLMTLKNKYKLRKEISNAIITYLKEATCHDRNHMKEFLDLYNYIDFSLYDSIKDSNMIDFLSKILVKESLKSNDNNENLPRNHKAIIRYFMLHTKNTENMTKSLEQFIANAMTNKIKDGELIMTIQELEYIKNKLLVKVK